LKLYPKYTTTVIGAYSVPDWYEPLDRLMSVGQLSMTAMSDAQYRASEAAIHDQERAGIDVITGGEMHRRTHNRHSPPNAMLNYFWQKIPAFHKVSSDESVRTHMGSPSALPSRCGQSATCTAWRSDFRSTAGIEERTRGRGSL
jgi:methionine synthase II (cobalamin-independent)